MPQHCARQPCSFLNDYLPAGRRRTAVRPLRKRAEHLDRRRGPCAGRCAGDARRPLALRHERPHDELITALRAAAAETDRLASVANDLLMSRVPTRLVVRWRSSHSPSISTGSWRGSPRASSRVARRPAASSRSSAHRSACARTRAASSRPSATSSTTRCVTATDVCVRSRGLSRGASRSTSAIRGMALAPSSRPTRLSAFAAERRRATARAPGRPGDRRGGRSGARRDRARRRSRRLGLAVRLTRRRLTVLRCRPPRRPSQARLLAVDHLGVREPDGLDGTARPPALHYGDEGRRGDVPHGLRRAVQPRIDRTAWASRRAGRSPPGCRHPHRLLARGDLADPAQCRSAFANVADRDRGACDAREHGGRSDARAGLAAKVHGRAACSSKPCDFLTTRRRLPAWQTGQRRMPGVRSTAGLPGAGQPPPNATTRSVRTPAANPQDSRASPSSR
jgi:hypothetical protein